MSTQVQDSSVVAPKFFGDVVVMSKRGDKDVIRAAVTQQHITFGKAPSCDMRIVNPRASDMHARLEIRDKGDAWLVPLSNSSDTLLNGLPLPLNTAKQLRNRDLISIAGRHFRWEAPKKSIPNASIVSENNSFNRANVVVPATATAKKATAGVQPTPAKPRQARFALRTPVRRGIAMGAEKMQMTRQQQSTRSLSTPVKREISHAAHVVAERREARSAATLKSPMKRQIQQAAQKTAVSHDARRAVATMKTPMKRQLKQTAADMSESLASKQPVATLDADIQAAIVAEATTVADRLALQQPVVRLGTPVKCELVANATHMSESRQAKAPKASLSDEITFDIMDAARSQEQTRKSKRLIGKVSTPMKAAIINSAKNQQEIRSSKAPVATISTPMKTELIITAEQQARKRSLKPTGVPLELKEELVVAAEQQQEVRQSKAPVAVMATPMKKEVRARAQHQRVEREAQIPQGKLTTPTKLELVATARAHQAKFEKKQPVAVMQTPMKRAVIQAAEEQQKARAEKQPIATMATPLKAQISIQAAVTQEALESKQPVAVMHTLMKNEVVQAADKQQNARAAKQPVATLGTPQKEELFAQAAATQEALASKQPVAKMSTPLKSELIETAQSRRPVARQLATPVRREIRELADEHAQHMTSKRPVGSLGSAMKSEIRTAAQEFADARPKQDRLESPLQLEIIAGAKRRAQTRSQTESLTMPLRMELVAAASQAQAARQAETENRLQARMDFPQALELKEKAESMAQLMVAKAEARAALSSSPVRSSIEARAQAIADEHAARAPTHSMDLEMQIDLRQKQQTFQDKNLFERGSPRTRRMKSIQEADFRPVNDGSSTIALGVDLEATSVESEPMTRSSAAAVAEPITEIVGTNDAAIVSVTEAIEEEVQQVATEPTIKTNAGSTSDDFETEKVSNSTPSDEPSEDVEDKESVMDAQRSQKQVKITEAFEPPLVTDATSQEAIFSEEAATSKDKLLTEDKITSMRVPELRAELEHRGLETKGLKAALVKRLCSAISEAKQNSIVSSSKEPMTESSAILLESATTTDTAAVVMKKKQGMVEGAAAVAVEHNAKAAAHVEQEPVVPQSDLNRMKVVELRAALQKRGLDTKGVKAALVDRLFQAISSSATNSKDNNVEDMSASSTDLTGNEVVDETVVAGSEEATANYSDELAKKQEKVEDAAAVAEEHDEPADHVEQEPVVSQSDLNRMKVVELRAALQERGLDTKGVKAALVDRLFQAMSSAAKLSTGNNVADTSAPSTDLTGNEVVAKTAVAGSDQATAFVSSGSTDDVSEEAAMQLELDASAQRKQVKWSDEVEDNEPSTPTLAQIKAMRVVDLKAELTKRSLDTSGLKAALTTRLVEHLKL